MPVTSCEDGSVSVEFVLWLPVLFFFILLVTDASAAFVAQAKMWHVAGDISRAIATGRITISEAHQFLDLHHQYTMNVQLSDANIAVQLSLPYSSFGTGIVLSFAGDMTVQVFQHLENGVQLSGEILS